VTKPRVHETDEGIVGEFNVQAYDEFHRVMRDRGWIETDLIIASGITSGHALEIGPGPGYLGLEWLKKTEGTRLTGAEISPDMITLATGNAEVYGLAARVEYVLADAHVLPFENDGFDGVFSNGSIHEWARPTEVLGEMTRVLRPGGIVVLSDLRRDMLPPVKWFIWTMTRPKAIRRGFLTSVASSYTPDEVKALLQGIQQVDWKVDGNPIGIVARGVKRLSD
jgi:ubiquinone/menaquinone biosynthesis C-methylase UbiE